MSCNFTRVSYKEEFAEGERAISPFPLRDQKRVRNYATNCKAWGWKMMEIATEAQENSSSASL